jgi:hypothetical protein
VLVEPAELQGDITEQELSQGQQGPQRDSGGVKQKVQGSPAPARPVKKSPSAADAAKHIESLAMGVMNPAMAKELAQFAKCLAKDPNAWETFEFRHADGRMIKAAVGIPPGGGASPKASSSNGPDGSELMPSSPYTRHS